MRVHEWVWIELLSRAASAASNFPVGDKKNVVFVEEWTKKKLTRIVKSQVKNVNDDSDDDDDQNWR